MAVDAFADRDTVLAALDAVDAALDSLTSACLDAFTPPELLKLLDRLEVASRRVPAVDHRVIQRLRVEASPRDLGATSWGKVLSERLRVSSGEAGRRVKDAEQLGPRTAITGEPLEPVLPHFAVVQAAGAIGAEHVAITRKFFNDLPAQVDRETRAVAERELAALAAQFGPEEYRNASNTLMALLHPDGDFDDADRQRRRGFRLSRQGADGLRDVSGTLTPECGVVFEAILAKLAAPGMCNPDDPQPCVTGRPTQAQIDADRRTPVQRNHDALLAAGRIVLSTKSLGDLNGLPVTVIVSTTLAELESGAGLAVTGGGSRLPIPDLIRNAAEAYHYLAIFDGDGKALHLGRSRRTASPAQRIVLYARDRGCTKPGCTAAGYRCQVHHLETDWAAGGLTDIDHLTLACGPDNRMATEFNWDTRLNADGRVEWIPPPHLDHGQPRVNSMHHPHDLFTWGKVPSAPPTPPAPPTLSRPRPGKPDRHDDDVFAYLLALDGTGQSIGNGPDDLRSFYDDIFGINQDPHGEALDDFLARLDPDLLLALDPDRDRIDDLVDQYP
jgi:Domain of unknown function (DUF222)